MVEVKKIIDNIRDTIVDLTERKPIVEVGITNKGKLAVDILNGESFDRAGYSVGESVYWRSVEFLLAGQGELVAIDDEIEVTEREGRIPINCKGGLCVELVVKNCVIPDSYQEYLDENPNFKVVPFKDGRRIRLKKGVIARNNYWDLPDKEPFDHNRRHVRVKRE
jgi:hypothetical protein